MSFPNHVTGKARAALGREWGKRSAAKWKPSEPDPKTLAYRHKQDRKGRTIAEGHDYWPDKTRHWLIRHSLHGDTDQVDLVINARLWRTGSLLRARNAIKWGQWQRSP